MDMAISEPMSDPSDWIHFYQDNLSSGQSRSTPVTTNFDENVPDINAQRSYSNMSGEAGRVSRPVRRRSRASRRTPVTLLNTDTSNFRAMVQQFTGVPSSFPERVDCPATASLGFGQNTTNPCAGMPATAFQLQFQRQQQNQYSQQQQYMFNSMQSDGIGFMHRPNMEVEVSNGLVNNGGSSHRPPPRAASAGVHNNYML